jgi:hypothetical protein
MRRGALVMGDGLARDVVRLASAQAALALAVVAAFLIFRDAAAAGGALAGSGIALVLTALHARRVRLATRATRSRPGSETLVLGIGVFERFAVAAGLFALGIGYWKLAPVPMIAGFAVCQVGWFLAGSLHRPDGSPRA